MSFDWQQDSKERYFSRAEAAVKAAGFDDILHIDRSVFTISKDKAKVYFKPISRDDNTRRWWEAKKAIEGIEERSAGRDQFGRKRKSIYIHAYMILDVEEQDK